MVFDHISDDIAPKMKILIFFYPHSKAFLQFHLKLEGCKPHKATCLSTNCDLINDVSSYFRQYIIGYTITNFLCYPIRRHITTSNALE